MFVPNVKLDDLLKVLQEPQTDKHKQEDVFVARRLARRRFAEGVPAAAADEVRDRVYDTEYDVDYKRMAPDRASATASRPESSRSKTPARRASARCRKATITATCGGSIRYWRYKQVDGGVLVEIESLTLSREPAGASSAR